MEDNNNRRFKKELKYRVADLLTFRQPKIIQPARVYSSEHPWKMNAIKEIRIPKFYIMDSAKEKYLSVVLLKKDIPHFMRKAGIFGMIWEKGLCIPVGIINQEIDALQVHIVTDEDLSYSDNLDQFKT